MSSVDEMDLATAGRTVLVTGGRSGIGRETVHALAGVGARVLLTGRDRSKGRAVVADVDAAGVTGEYFEDCEPSDPATASADDEHRRRLWDLSAELTGLSSDETVGDWVGSVSQRT